MPTHRTFKTLVRTRMARTGESYTTARAVLLAHRPELDPAPTGGDTPLRSESMVLATSEEKIRERTGYGWEEWFDRLDVWGACDHTHREIARWLAAELDCSPLAWNVQAITGSYERSYGLREVGQHEDGFAATISRTVEVPSDVAFAAVVGDRTRWLDLELIPRPSRFPRAHFDVVGTRERVHIGVDPKGPGRSVVSVRHERLADAGAADAVKATWRSALEALRSALAAGVQPRDGDLDA